MHNETVTLREALNAGAASLAEEDDLRESAVRDAELLLRHTLGVSRTAVYSDPGRELTDGQVAEYRAAIARRRRGEPVQYILGQQEFFGLMLRVTPAVLIPRPETEALVEAVLARLSAAEPQRIVDVGTGSGAIAIAIAKHLAQAEVTALDISVAALAVARANALECGVDERVRFVESDLLDGVAREGLFDAIVSNPPYVALADRGTLHRQVLEFEPAMALFAGDDGLEVYRRLVPQAFAMLKPGGLVALEIGYGQKEAVAELLGDWSGVEFVEDLQGIPRVAIGRRRN